MKPDKNTLSPALIDVWSLVARGLTTKQVAAARGTSVKTIDAQIGALFKILGVYSRAGLVHAAYQRGLVSVGSLAKEKIREGLVYTSDERVNSRRMIIGRTMDEMDAQDSKWGAQSHTPERWMNILVEEVGEVAEAINSHVFDGASQPEALINAETELIQTAAVAIQMANDLRRQRLGLKGPQ